MEEAANNKWLLTGIIVAAVLLFGGLAWVILRAPDQLLTVPVEENVTFDDTNDPWMGAAQPLVTVHIYGDFQCPACRIAEQGVKYAEQKYGDRVRFVWKDFPLPMHNAARPAALAARCAQAQGKFWEMHDKLYDGQDIWPNQPSPVPAFTQYAKDIGLDAAAFSQCLTLKTPDAKIDADIAEGDSQQVQGTPTFFIGRRRYQPLAPSGWDDALALAFKEKSP